MVWEKVLWFERKFWGLGRQKEVINWRTIEPEVEEVETLDLAKIEKGELNFEEEELV